MQEGEMLINIILVMVVPNLASTFLFCFKAYVSYNYHIMQEITFSVLSSAALTTFQLSACKCLK